MENAEKLKHFKTTSGQRFENTFHGFDGPITLTYDPLIPLDEAFVSAAKKKGLRWRDDSNEMYADGQDLEGKVEAFLSF